MVRSGCLRPFAYLVSPRIIFIFTVISFVAASEVGVPIEIKLWDSKRAPLAHMVDVTNEFGLKVLAEHNFLNDNNIAFSPYGLMGILVALYEGTDGESSYQIQRSMQLPWNRNVMRIGFRDIHRTLKTYFVPEEGFLAGLALNNENVTFNESYQKILRFYGFDLSNEQPSASTKGNETSSIQTTPLLSNMSTTEITTVITTEKVTGREDFVKTTVSTKEETTQKPNTETLSGKDTAGSQAKTTALPSITSTSSIGSTDFNPSSPITTQTTNQESTLNVTPTETVALSTTIETTFITQVTTEMTESTTNNDNLTSTTQAMTPSTDVATEESDSSTNSPISMTSTQITGSEASSTPLLEATQDAEMSTLSTETTTMQSTIPTTSGLETLQRKKKSIVDFLYTSPPYADVVYRSFDVGIDLPEENENDDKTFLVNGLRYIQVTYMHYDSVLEHAYLPHLEASALRLPLDSDRYYLLVVLPRRRGTEELGRLLNRMARESDLSDVYAALQPRRVRAVVPSFTVKGHVTLTTDLQKLGIHDVFEPRQHDFTPMTPQPGVYVRSIEQAVSVAIRKYQPDVKNRYVSSRTPVSFSATHPFLYFVMDSNIHVALMAGKMVDPLNTRIL